MKEKLEESVLQKFQNGIHILPAFEDENEKKIFLQLQKYNLIYMTPEGLFVISKRGKEALEYGVEKFLALERFEKRLLKDSMTRETERKWIFFAVIPLILALSFGLLFLQLNIL